MAAAVSSPSLPPGPSQPVDSSSSPYVYAAAPDIIRAHQKDAYFQGSLTNQIADLHRRLLGARSAHTWAAETRTAADLLYLGLTTLLGNRTLGEEYCDLVQVETDGAAPAAGAVAAVAGSASAFPRLPSLSRRAAYISGSILLPYAAGRVLPALRGRLRAVLAARLAATQRSKTTTTTTTEARVLRYLLAHLPALTSGTHARALALAVFYFTGAYYSLAKRAVGLRYVFTRRVAVGAGTDRAGYEVLGLLLAAQLAAQGWLHVRAVLREGETETQLAEDDSNEEEDAWERQRLRPGDIDVSLDENAYSSNNELLLEMDSGSRNASGAKSLTALGAMAHTPVVVGGRGARFDLRDDAVMAWIEGQQRRRCTLCLEELRDPAATPCGHVFCWTCIGDWVREKPECPLCRRGAMAQHVLPLRAA